MNLIKDILQGKFEFIIPVFTFILSMIAGICYFAIRYITYVYRIWKHRNDR